MQEERKLYSRTEDLKLILLQLKQARAPRPIPELAGLISCAHAVFRAHCGFYVREHRIILGVPSQNVLVWHACIRGHKTSKAWTPPQDASRRASKRCGTNPLLQVISTCLAPCSRNFQHEHSHTCFRWRARRSRQRSGRPSSNQMRGSDQDVGGCREHGGRSQHRVPQWGPLPSVRLAGIHAQ